MCTSVTMGMTFITQLLCNGVSLYQVCMEFAWLSVRRDCPNYSAGAFVPSSMRSSSELGSNDGWNQKSGTVYNTSHSLDAGDQSQTDSNWPQLVLTPCNSSTRYALLQIYTLQITHQTLLYGLNSWHLTTFTTDYLQRFKLGLTLTLNVYSCKNCPFWA